MTVVAYVLALLFLSAFVTAVGCVYAGARADEREEKAQHECGLDEGSETVGRCRMEG